jgi:outer membrane protein
MQITARQLINIWHKIVKQMSRIRIYILKLTVNLALIFVFVALSVSVKSQETWNLGRCIKYALENNIDIQIQKNRIKTSEINVAESKANLFPSLGLGSSLGMNFGRNIDGNTNAVTYNQTMGNRYWLSSSMVVFQGFAKTNTLRFNKILRLAENELLEFTKNKLVFNVINSYYSLAYKKELAKIAATQLNLSTLQLKRLQKFYELGKESRVKVEELQSLQANDKLSMVRAENIAESALLDLKQLLRINFDDKFTIDSVDVDLPIFETPRPQELFNNSVETLPQIKREILLLDASYKNLLVAKGSLFPRLSFSGGMGTNYFDGSKLGFKKQLNNNQNQWLNFRLSIPVFDGASVRSRVKQRKVEIENHKLNLAKQHENLYTEINKAVEDFHAAKSELQAANELQHFSKTAFRNAGIRLEKGLIGIADYELAKQKFMLAKATLTRAKLTFIIQKNMIEFYKTGSWNWVFEI